MEFEVLGPVRLLRDGEATRLGRMQRLLLSVLLVHANRPVSGDLLADALWDGVAAARVEQNLRLHIHRLRRLLGDRERLSFGPGGYRLVVQPGELDAERFESLVDDASEVVGDDPQRTADLLREALALWQGTPYEGLDDPVLTDEGQRLTDRRISATESLYDAELNRGHDVGVVDELTDLVRRYPLRERLATLLMTALYRSGRQADALQVYQDARRRLVDELGLEPGPELRAIEQQVLAGEPVNVGVRGSVSMPVPAQLPPNVRGFAGREDEIATLNRLLSVTTDSTVIATLSGTAGVGKTALAVRWAHRVRDRFPDGQLYIDLRGYGPDAPLAPEDALAGFLRALGVAGVDVPQELDERAARYRSLLDGRRMLVVLDNARAADQVRPLLPSAASCAVLITSRDSLVGLGVRDGAERIGLHRLGVDEARDLMTSLLGDDTAVDTEALDRLIEQCARLPLALRIAVDLVRTRPARGGLPDWWRSWPTSGSGSICSTSTRIRTAPRVRCSRGPIDSFRPRRRGCFAGADSIPVARSTSIPWRRWSGPTVERSDVISTYWFAPTCSRRRRTDGFICMTCSGRTRGSWPSRTTAGPRRWTDCPRITSSLFRQRLA